MTGSSNDDSARARREPELVRLFAQARAKHPAASVSDLIKEVLPRLPKQASVVEVRRIATLFRLPTHMVG